MLLKEGQLFRWLLRMTIRLKGRWSTVNSTCAYGHARGCGRSRCQGGSSSFYLLTFYISKILFCDMAHTDCFIRRTRIGLNIKYVWYVPPYVALIWLSLHSITKNDYAHYQSHDVSSYGVSACVMSEVGLSGWGMWLTFPISVCPADSIRAAHRTWEMKKGQGSS